MTFNIFQIQGHPLSGNCPQTCTAAGWPEHPPQLFKLNNHLQFSSSQSRGATRFSARSSVSWNRPSAAANLLRTTVGGQRALCINRQQLVHLQLPRGETEQWGGGGACSRRRSWFAARAPCGRLGELCTRQLHVQCASSFLT